MLTPGYTSSTAYLLQIAPAMAKVTLRGLLSMNRHALAAMAGAWWSHAWRAPARWWRSWRTGLPRPTVLQVVDDVQCAAGCSHCVFSAFKVRGTALSRDELASLLDQAADLGVSHVYLLGADPFYKDDPDGFLSLLASRRRLIFYLFTEGRRVTPAHLDFIERAGNLVPVVNVDGLQAACDARKGEGTFAALGTLLDELRRRRVPWFVSTMVSTANLVEVTSRPFIDWLADRGAWLVAYVPYLPADARSQADLVLTPRDRQALYRNALALNRGRSRPLVLDLVGIEEHLTSCPSCRHMVTVFHDGTVAPCVGLPFGHKDANVRKRPLADVLLHDPLHRAVRARGATDPHCMVFGESTFVREYLAAHRDEVVLLAPSMLDLAASGREGGHP